MKTSNKLVIAGIAIFIAFLVAYDTSLQAAYKSKNYRHELRTFTSFDCADFDAIELHAARFAGVRITQGACKVMINKKDRSFVNIRKEGRRLIVNVESSANFQSDLENGYCIYISCPVLHQLSIDNTYRQNGLMVTDSIGGGYAYYPKITLQKFVQDSILVTESDVSYLKLDSCTIKCLNAVVGDKKETKSTIDIPEGNSIGHASLMVIDGAYLKLGCTPNSTDYHLSGKADVSLTGSVLNNMLTRK